MKDNLGRTSLQIRSETTVSTRVPFAQKTRGAACNMTDLLEESHEQD